jgi:uncharacterized protein (TIGR00106 family)
MATLEISILPVGTASTSMSPWVAACHQLLRSTFSDLTIELTAMGTNLEGPLPRLLEAVQALHESPFQSGAQRVYTVVKIDDRRDKESRLDQKVAAVEKLIPGPSLLGQCVRYLEKLSG